MNNKATTMSLLMAVIAVFFVQSYVQSIEDEAKKKFGTEVLVVKAKKDIKENETITEAALELVPIPKRFLEPASVAFDDRNDEEKAKKTMKQLSGTIAIVPIRKEEQLTYNKITEPSIRTGLAPQITPGRRAVAVPVNDITGVSKLVKPGDRIDLIAIIDGGGSKTNKIAKTVLQDVVVLAVGRNVTNNVARIVEQDSYTGKDRVRSLSEDASFGTVTLEVEPLQAQLLTLIQSGGDSTLMLSLRNNDDTERVELGATGFMDIMGADAARMQRQIAGGR
jgi:pilus assembly protein CpaB